MAVRLVAVQRQKKNGMEWNVSLDRISFSNDDCWWKIPKQKRYFFRYSLCLVWPSPNTHKQYPIGYWFDPLWYSMNNIQYYIILHLSLLFKFHSRILSVFVGFGKCVNCCKEAWNDWVNQSSRDVCVSAIMCINE